MQEDDKRNFCECLIQAFEINRDDRLDDLICENLELDMIPSFVKKYVFGEGLFTHNKFDEGAYQTFHDIVKNIYESNDLFPFGKKKWDGYCAYIFSLFLDVFEVEQEDLTEEQVEIYIDLVHRLPSIIEMEELTKKGLHEL